MKVVAWGIGRLKAVSFITINQVRFYSSGNQYLFISVKIKNRILFMYRIRIWACMDLV